MDERPESTLKAPHTERLAALRGELAARGLDGLIVPLQDEHQGEEVPACSRRLTWLTGFTGSAGLAVVLHERAALFVDGRYTLQVRKETDTALFEPRHLSDEPPARWIAKHLGGERLGYDPWLQTPQSIERFQKAADEAGGELIACKANPIDAAWSDRPAPPDAPIVVHDLKYAGESSAEKRRRLAAALASEEHAAAVITLADSIAWLFNVRGADLVYSPVTLGFAILRNDATADLFVDPEKADAAVRAHLGNEVTVRPRADFPAALDALGGDEAHVLADPGTAPAYVYDRLESAGATVVRGVDPCQLSKACKNDTELEGIRTAHVRDGATLTRLLCWLGRESPKGTITELDVSARSDELRRAGRLCTGLSFPAITGAGPNGAIVHYRVSEATNRTLKAGELFLLDSGGQYLDGTTDVTRTIAVGEPGPEERTRFTLVLKGHIALATARFPEGTSGAQLDMLARQALWQAGLDYDHGSGHGVGSYLNVHEGPQRISKIPNRQALKSGMIVSNEPGYYKEGAYGIRIENLLAVRAAPAPKGAEKDLLEFETLTLAPIDRHLIDAALLDAAERAWVDTYHARVRETLAPHLDSDTADWLTDATAPLEGAP